MSPPTLKRRIRQWRIIEVASGISALLAWLGSMCSAFEILGATHDTWLRFFLGFALSSVAGVIANTMGGVLSMRALMTSQRINRCPVCGAKTVEQSLERCRGACT